MVFKKYLRPFALDENSLSVSRVKYIYMYSVVAVPTVANMPSLLYIIETLSQLNCFSRDTRKSLCIVSDGMVL